MSKKFTLADSEPRIRQFLDLMISRAGFALTYAVSAGETVHPDFENPDVLVRFSGTGCRSAAGEQGGAASGD